MTSEKWISYGAYKNLTAYEFLTIRSYFNDYNKLGIEKFLRSGDGITQGMRDFIADVLAEKKETKRPPGKRSHCDDRDFEIHWRVCILISRGWCRTGQSDKSASAAIAEVFGIEDDAVNKAYDKIEAWTKKEFGVTGMERLEQNMSQDDLDELYKRALLSP